MSESEWQISVREPFEPAIRVHVTCVIYLKRISGILPLVLVASSSFPVEHRSVVVALRERLRRVLVGGRLTGLGTNTGVGILSRVELVVMWRLAPCLRLHLMSGELNTPSLIRVPLRGVGVIVTFILIEENSCYRGR